MLSLSRIGPLITIAELDDVVEPKSPSGPDRRHGKHHRKIFRPASRHYCVHGDLPHRVPPPRGRIADTLERRPEHFIRTVARAFQHRLHFFFRGDDDRHVVRHSIIHEDFLQVVRGVRAISGRSCRDGLHPGLFLVVGKRRRKVVNDLFHDLYSGNRIGIHEICCEFVG